MFTDTVDTDIAPWTEWIKQVPEELRNSRGIKAQYAATVAIQKYLSTLAGDWNFVPTEVGGYEDLRGIDGYLENTRTNTYYAIDFSLMSRNHASGRKADQIFLVHMRDNWFSQADDGSWTLRTNCLRALQMAFLPALQTKPIAWTPAHLLATPGAA